MVNKIYIESASSNLVGYSEGKQKYSEIEGNIKYGLNIQNVLIFPFKITNVSVTYVNGLLEGIFKVISKEDFNLYFRVEGREVLVEKISTMLKKGVV